MPPQNEQDLAGWCFLPVLKPPAVGPSRRRRAPREYKKINSPVPCTAYGCGDRAMAPLTNAPASWFGRDTLQIVSAWMTLQRQGSWVAVLAKATAAIHIQAGCVVCRPCSGVVAVAPVSSVQCLGPHGLGRPRLLCEDQTSPVLCVFCVSARWAKIACIFLDLSRVDGFVFDLSGHPVPTMPAIGARVCTAASHSDFSTLHDWRLGGVGDRKQRQGPGATGETRANKRRPTESTRRAD